PNPAATLCAGESAADSRACRAWSAMLKYDTDTWGLALSHEELRGGPGETLGLVSSGHKDRRAIANGWAKFGGLRVNAGVLNRRRDAATAQDSNLWFVGASYSPLAQLSVAAEFHRLDLKASPDDTDLLVLRAVY